MDDDLIDFDAAQAAWRANKRHIGGGAFEYVCHYIHSNGKPCRSAALVFRFCKKRQRGLTDAEHRDIMIRLEPSEQRGILGFQRRPHIHLPCRYTTY